MWVTGEVADDRGDPRGDGDVRARAARRAGRITTRISPTACSARSSRRPGRLRTRTYVDDRILEPARARRGRPGRSRSRGRGLPRRRVRRHRAAASRTPTCGGVAAMGQLWSTVGDLCRWAAFLADGRRRRARRSDGRRDVVPAGRCMNPDEWTVGWGLGLELVASEGRVFGGHGGAMPGFLAGVYVNREAGRGAAVLTNSGTPGCRRATSRSSSPRATIELWPPEIEPWRPELAPPPEHRRAARPLVVGGQRVRVRVGGRQARAREMPGAPAADQADGVRAAPRAASAPSRGGSTGSGCASRATGSSGPATCSRGRQEPTPA